MKYNFTVFVVQLLFQAVGFAQNGVPDKDCNVSYRIAFWNVENYFDVMPDSSIHYTEFDSGGVRYWTKGKYYEKRNKIYKSIAAMGEWQPPVIIGFAEIENEYVLNDLIYNTPLRKLNYRTIHYESEDPRGIDVGMIYQPGHFKVLSSKKVSIKDSTDANFSTRDILYVNGLLEKDTLHIFINHWTSRFRGTAASEPLRILAAKTLRKVTDSILSLNPASSILIMGDLNDNADNESIKTFVRTDSASRFADMEYSVSNKDVQGTLKYQGKWDIFDHFIVSVPLMSNDYNLTIKGKTAFIFSPDFLLEKDEKYLGLKPKRTYTGYKYNGGISDHLPVYVDICINNNK